jgi:hypothetical protein
MWKRLAPYYDLMSLKLPGETRGVKKKFDVIVCLFASIAYTRTYANVWKVITRFSEHLHQGGVVIIDPFVSPRYFRPGYFDGVYVDRPEIKLCRLTKTRLRGNIATLDCHFLLVTKEGIRRFHDIHRIGCFSENRVLQIMRECGLRSRFLKKGLMTGRGLYVGVKK